MLTKTVDIAESSENFAEWVSLARAGTKIVLTDRDTPVARIVPVAPVRKKRIAGLHEGETWMSDDFDAPLPDEFWGGKI